MNPIPFRLSALVTIGALFIGCGEAPPDDGEDDPFLASGKSDGAGGTGLAEGSAEASGVLALVNQASFETLDVAVGLSSLAAQGIVDYREGAEETGPRRFESLASLDAIRFVGPVSLARLLAHARATGLVVSGWRERAPAGGFSLAIAIAGELVSSRCSSSSYFDSNPGCQSVTSAPGALALQLGRDTQGVLTVSYLAPTGLLSTVIGADGRFQLSNSRESCGERSCSKSTVTLAGRVSDDGQVTVERFRSFSVGGNQALGFTITIRELAGSASVPLPW